MKRGSDTLTVSVSPFRCRLWALHDRAEDYLTEDSCREEIQSFQKHGQLVPVLGRRLNNDPDHDVELIFGARRLFVARHLNLPLRAEIRDMTDREAIIAMDIENRQRKDISPYERGRSYARWLRDGHFKSQDDIAHALHISASQVSRLLKVARLPAVVLNAFRNPQQICEGWAISLAAALEDSERRERTIRKARELSQTSTRASAHVVYRQLLGASCGGRKPTPGRHDEVVLSCHGRPLFRIRYGQRSLVLLLPVETVPASVLRAIRNAVTSLLEPDQASEVPAERRPELHKVDHSRLGERDEPPRAASAG